MSEQARLQERFGRRFTSGEVIFREGGPATEAYLIQTGRVRLIKRAGGTERGLRVLGAGDLFGESALVPGAPHNSTAVALEETLTLALDAVTFEHILTGNAAVGLRVIQQLVRRTRDAEDQVEIYMLRDSHSKVVVALLKLAQQSTRSNNDSGRVVVTVTPMELSARVGLDVETVKRKIQQLRGNGYLEVVDEHIEIDAAALTELSSLFALEDQLAGPQNARAATARARTR